MLVNLKHYFLWGKYASKFDAVISNGANILVNLKHFFSCGKYISKFGALFLTGQIC